MTFEERLVQLRKARGMSQEELAEKVGVSRQAVSKWETGDAQPDYVKLMALADALGVSLDDLCGREPPSAPAGQTETPAPESAPKKKRWVFWLAAVLAAVLLLGVGVLIGSRIASGSVRPQDVTISNVEFYTYDDSDKLFYQFIPSVIGKDYAYQIVFITPDGTERVFAADCGAAGCSGQVSLAGGIYDVSVVVLSGGDQYVIPVAEDLCFEHRGGATWTPHDSSERHESETHH